MSDDESDFLEAASGFTSSSFNRSRNDQKSHNPFDDDDDSKKQGIAVQYANYGAGFKAMTSTIKSLPAGCYDVSQDNNGIFVTPALPPSGLLLKLPEMRSDEVIKMVEKFWASEKDYKEGNEFVIGGAAYKSGIMLYGPPGSGKSCTIKLVSKMLVDLDGIVFFGSNHPAVLTSFLENFSRIEPNRKCIVILEDIDSLVQVYGESNYLELLDSAKTIDNVMFISTTNYPERLDPRIYNRPGRFSHVIKIGYPTPVAREAYLKAVLKDHRDVEFIVGNSHNFTIDHLSALINAVYREKKELKLEIERLRRLFKIPKVEEERKMGFEQ